MKHVPFLYRRFRNPWMAMSLWIPVTGLLLTVSLWNHPVTWAAALIYIALGLFAWTLVEYFLHRYVFHWVDESEKRRAYSKVASGLHIEHHQSTSQEDLIIAPPAVSLIFATLIFGIFLAATRSSAAAALLETGLIAGYLFYEWVHYGAHRFHPKSLVGKFLRKYHLQHHHKCPDRQFGVTTPIWDHVFGTR